MILAAGYANVDLIARLPDSAPLGRRVTVPRIDVAPGGMAANTACVAASLGSSVALFAAIGSDSFGTLLRDAWRRFGVDATRVQTRADRPTTKCLITVHPGGDRTIISESMSFDYAPLRAFLSAGLFPAGSMVFFDGYRLTDFHDAAEAARKGGCAVAADLDGCDDARVLSDALPLLDVVFGNAAAFARLAGPGPLPEALALLAARGPGIVVATAGGEGAWILSAGRMVHVPGHAVDAVDTTGAGDTFDGAFLHAYGRSGDELWSARYANAAAAISTTGTGALGRVPKDEEIRGLLDG